MSSRKKIIIIFSISVVVFAIYFVSQSSPESKDVYHVTLAESKKFENGLFTDNFKIQSGDYRLKFVLNGDSPTKLRVFLYGNNMNQTRDFYLNGTLHQTAISRYYTWDYVGDKDLRILQSQELGIIINPNGNTNGSLSLYIQKV